MVGVVVHASTGYKNTQRRRLDGRADSRDGLGETSEAWQEWDVTGYVGSDVVGERVK
jgi:hypothetical protein